MIAPEENLTTRVYNVAGMSFTPDILYNEVKKHVPNLAIEYNIDDRQKIGKIQMKKELNRKMESKYFEIVFILHNFLVGSQIKVPMQSMQLWPVAHFWVGAPAKHTLARTDLLYMLNWGTQWTMVSYLKNK